MRGLRRGRRQDASRDPRRRGVDVDATLARRRRRRRLHGRGRTVVLVGLLVVLLLAGGWLVLFSPYLTAEKVAVSGAGPISPLRIRHQAEVPLGGPLARVDLAAIQARVESIAAVESAAVSRSWPHTVQITVTPRTPVALVEDGSSTRAVDAAGVLFTPPPGRLRVPVIRTDARTGPASLREGARVAAALSPALARRTDHLELRSPDDIRLVLRDGRTVVWGSAADSATKARVADLLLRRKVSVVDVSVPGRPTTR